MLANKMGGCSTRWLYLVVVSMASVVLPLLLLALSCMLQTTLARVVVTANLHMPLPTEACQDAGASSSCTRALFLNPDHVVAAPAALQSDTFSHVQHVQYLDTVVPVCVTAAHTPLHIQHIPIYACDSGTTFASPGACPICSCPSKLLSCRLWTLQASARWRSTPIKPPIRGSSDIRGVCSFAGAPIMMAVTGKLT